MTAPLCARADALATGASLLVTSGFRLMRDWRLTTDDYLPATDEALVPITISIPSAAARTRGK
jgi:hypothetical protein